MTARDRPCASVWAQIGAREFREWRGIPVDCDYRDFDQWFPRLSDAIGNGSLGRQILPSTFRVHVDQNHDHNLKVWFRGAADLVLIEIKYPNLPYSGRDLSQRLGDPQARIDYFLDVMPIRSGAWVYAERGITVFMDVDHAQVMSLALFHPCDLTDYIDGIHPDNRTWELPVEA